MALRSLDGTSFVLAGAGAIREHGLVDRPTEDVDLFTSDVDLPRFSSAVTPLCLACARPATMSRSCAASTNSLALK